MADFKDSTKVREWVRRYAAAELLGTVVALLAASWVYAQSHSYATAAAAGWAGEGLGFYGYFIVKELRLNSLSYREHSVFKRLSLALAVTVASLSVEFLPAEIVDNFIIRPFGMYLAPQYIHPYAMGFLAGKLAADLFFYILAIAAYEARKAWVNRPR